MYFIHLLLNMKYILDFVFLYVDILSSVCCLFWFPSFVNPLLDTYLICGRWMFLHCCKWRCGCSRLTVFFEGYWDCGCSSWSRCGMQHLVCVCVCVPALVCASASISEGTIWHTFDSVVWLYHCICYFENESPVDALPKYSKTFMCCINTITLLYFPVTLLMYNLFEHELDVIGDC